MPDVEVVEELADAILEAEEAQVEINGIEAQAVDEAVSGDPTVEQADRDLIAAEIKASKDIARINATLEKARSKAVNRREVAIAALDDVEAGYVARVWGTHVNFQCIWCAFDAFDKDRILDHLAQSKAVSHNGLVHAGPATFERTGLPVVGRG